MRDLEEYLPEIAVVKFREHEHDEEIMMKMEMMLNMIKMVIIKIMTLLRMVMTMLAGRWCCNVFSF